MSHTAFLANKRPKDAPFACNTASHREIGIITITCLRAAPIQLWDNSPAKLSNSFCDCLRHLWENLRLHAIKAIRIGNTIGRSDRPTIPMHQMITRLGGLTSAWCEARNTDSFTCA